MSLLHRKKQQPKIFCIASRSKHVMTGLVLLATLSYAEPGRANPTQQALLIASPITKESCGGFEHRESYVLKSIGYSNRGEVSTARQQFDKELRATHGTRIKVDSVHAGQCLVIARTLRRINGCQFADFMWRTGIDAESTQSALAGDIRSTSNVKEWNIEKVQCMPVNNDVSIGVRG